MNLARVKCLYRPEPVFASREFFRVECLHPLDCMHTEIESKIKCSGVSPSPGQCAPAGACPPQHRNHPAPRARPRGGLRLLDAGIVAVEAGEVEFQELGWRCCLLGAALFEGGAEGRKPRRVERCDGLARGRWQFSIHPLAQPTEIRGRNIRSEPSIVWEITGDRRTHIQPESSKERQETMRNNSNNVHLMSDFGSTHPLPGSMPSSMRRARSSEIAVSIFAASNLPKSAASPPEHSLRRHPSNLSQLSEG